MSRSETAPSVEAIRFKDVYGIFVLSPDDVQFRTGSLSGTACVVSDPERRGLLGPIIERLLSPDAMQRRPWNQAEVELLQQVIPQLQQSGIVEVADRPQVHRTDYGFPAPILRKDLVEARIAVVGHGVLGEAIGLLLAGMPCGSITVIESSSVAQPSRMKPTAALAWSAPPASCAGVPQRLLARPQNHAQWVEAVGDHDWLIAAQDSFEPEELALLNEAALQLSLPWSLLCFDGYEGWLGRHSCQARRPVSAASRGVSSPVLPSRSMSLWTQALKSTEFPHRGRLGLRPAPGSHCSPLCSHSN